MKFFYMLTITLVIICDVIEYLNLHCNTTSYKCSVFPNVIIDSWNSLDVDTQNQHSTLVD